MKAVLRPGSIRKPALKEPKKKKTLKEVAGTMLSDMVEKARVERLRPILEKQKEQEDEIAAMMFGPDWNADPVQIPIPAESSTELAKKKDDAA